METFFNSINLLSITPWRKELSRYLSEFKRPYLFLLGAFFFSLHLYASAVPDQEWLRLHHYIQENGRWRSLVEDPRFFIDPDGSQNPQKELSAFMKEWKSSQKKAEELQCRFPLRASWLYALDSDIKTVELCQELVDFRVRNRSNSLQFVYANAYFGHPASMFGHTFLRLGQYGVSDYRAPVVDYSAKIEGSPPLWEYAYKGMSGRFPGRYTIAPYYMKIHQYGSMESRGLWLFTLDFSQDELNRLIDHIWELKGLDTHYYFLSRNCAYNLLRLLSVATRKDSLAYNPESWTLPSEVIHDLGDHNLIQKIEYEPSLSSRIQSLSSNLSKDAVERSLKASQSNFLELENLSAKELDLGSLWFLYSHRDRMKTHTGYENIKKTLYQFSYARSKLKDHRVKEKHNEASPHLSHKIQKFSVVHHGKNLRLGYMPGYHGLLDPGAGFVKGLSLEILSLSLATDYKNLWLHEARVFQSTSLNSMDKIFQQLSWSISFDIQSSKEKEWFARPDVAVGASFFADHILSFLFLGATNDIFHSLKLDPYLSWGTILENRYWKFLYQLKVFSPEKRNSHMFLSYYWSQQSIFVEYDDNERFESPYSIGYQIFY